MYRGAKYWESEVPAAARAGAVRLRLFRQAGRLQIHRTFTNAAGEERTAAVVTIDIEALALAPEARALLAEALAASAQLTGEEQGA